MHAAFKRVEAHKSSAGPAGLQAHHAAPQIEDHQQRQHADDRNRANDAQRDLVEITPLPAGRLDEHARPLSRDRNATIDLTEGLQQLLFVDRAGRGVDGSVRIALRLLGGRRERRAATNNKSSTPAKMPMREN